jgi:DNA-binding CsgD family transcriptional regulator
MARVAIDEGAARTGHERYMECLAHFRAMGDSAGTCSVVEDLSDLALRNRQPEQAEHLLRESLDIRQKLGADWAFVYDGMLGPGFSHQLIATARALLPDPPTALEDFFRDLVGFRARWQGRAGLAVLFEDLASALAARGDHVHAARVAGYAATLGARSQPRTLLEEWQSGHMLSPEQALAHALCAPTVDPGRAEIPKRNARPAGLTERETDVLRLVARGMTNHDIGIQLVISERTAAKHLDNAFRKIGVTSRAGAAAFAIRAGIA